MTSLIGKNIHIYTPAGASICHKTAQYQNRQGLSFCFPGDDPVTLRFEKDPSNGTINLVNASSGGRYGCQTEGNYSNRIDYTGFPRHLPHDPSPVNMDRPIIQPNGRFFWRTLRGGMPNQTQTNQGLMSILSGGHTQGEFLYKLANGDQEFKAAVPRAVRANQQQQRQLPPGSVLISIPMC